MANFQFQHREDEHEVKIKSIGEGVFNALVDQEEIDELTLKRGGKNEISLQIGDQYYDVFIYQRGNTYHIAINGQTFVLDKITAEARRQRNRAQDQNQLSASMPAQVLEVLVKVGDEVKLGDTLIILEAMKMEQRIKSGNDGTIKAIHCKAGESVERGQALIEIS